MESIRFNMVGCSHIARYDKSMGNEYKFIDPFVYSSLRRLN